MPPNYPMTPPVAFPPGMKNQLLLRTCEFRLSVLHLEYTWAVLVTHVMLKKYIGTTFPHPTELVDARQAQIWKEVFICVFL